MPYRAPVGDLRFVLDHVAGFGAVAATERFADAMPDVVTAALAEAGRIATDVLAPVNRVGDRDGVRLEDGAVVTPPGFAEAYRQIAEGGWVGMAANPAHGGQGLPFALSLAVDEMMAGACLALQLKPLLSKGQIEALERHASAELKALVLPKLISGAWSATMNLTEPQAGSDVGALRCRAEPNGDGTYAVTGQKIFITWGDSDLVANVCHLVLARLPGAAAGTKGLSLFLVPKLLLDGQANKLRVVGLERKLGLHASPTCVMAYEGAVGWLVGGPHQGMAAMFTMMNNARLGVAAQGVGVAEAALQQAVAYAGERRQGLTPLSADGPIVEHADVRRMLALIRAEVFAARAITLTAGVAVDMARATGSAAWQARAGVLTPIAKAYATDVGCWVADQGMQVHGGMGYVEATGAAQFWRDVRVTPIYEGTNGIQAMDLVGRKLADGGKAALALVDGVAAGAVAARSVLPDLAGEIDQAAAALRRVTQAMAALPLVDRQAGAVPYLRAFARLLGADAHLKAALADPARVPLARVMVRWLLPEHAFLCQAAVAGADALYAMTDAGLDG